MNIKPIQEQINILAEAFNVNPYSVVGQYRLPELPKEAIGWIAVVNWSNIFCFYNKAVKTAMYIIKNKGIDSNLYMDNHKFDRILELNQVAKEQKENDIILVPLLKEDAKTKENSLGLGLFEILCLCITHPELLSVENERKFLCQGDKISSSIPLLGFSSCSSEGKKWKERCIIPIFSEERTETINLKLIPFQLEKVTGVSWGD